MPVETSFSEAQRDAVLRALAVFQPAAVYLFGSLASGTARPDSDVDLAMLPGIAVDPLARFNAANELANALGREVDLVDLHRASTVLAKEVIRGGVVLEDSRPSERQEFEMRTLSDYARLNEERQPVIETLT